MVQPIQGPDGPKPISRTSRAGRSQNTSNVPTNMTIPDTKEAKETKRRIETAKYQLEILKAKAKDPNIKPEEAKKVAAEIAVLDNVYKNSSYTIAPDGSVTFSIKKDISVTDFRKAYGLQEGAMQAHLKKRHESEGESVGIVEARIYTDGRTMTEEDYDDDMVRYVGGKPATGADGMMELDFMQGDRGSYIVYSDGMVLKQVKTFFGGTSQQIQYDNMSLRPGEKLTLPQSKIKAE